jgi:hypothetical protein
MRTRGIEWETLNAHGGNEFDESLIDQEFPMRTTRMLACASSLAAAATVGFTAPASAAPTNQQGLVNIDVSNLDVQVPVAVAANVCDVNVGVLVQQLRDAAQPCTVDAESVGMISRPDSGPVNQRGLVNLAITDVTVQVPVTVAANVCDVNVAVLVSDLEDDAATCAADASGLSVITPVG